MTGKTDTGETDHRLFPLERKVRGTIRRYGMLQPADRVLVGVSGGADSTALLLCLHRLAPEARLSLVAGHLNHQLRGAEADEDERFVGALCTDLGLSLVSEKTDVSGLAARRKLNLEDAARRARYDFLRRTAEKLDCRKIAVGHNLNDQAESVLIRFLRGSGPDGLSGIHPVLDGLVIRPLLECSRAEIEAYLQSRGRSHREDSSNMELKLRRNRVRHELIPYLEQHFNPRLLEALARSATRARDIAQYLDLEAGAALEGIKKAAGPDSVILSVKGLADLPAVIRSGVIRRAVRECRGSLAGISDLHVREVARLAASRHSGHSIDLPGGLAVGLQFDELILGQTRAGSRSGFCHKLPIPGSCIVPEARLEFLARRGPWPEARPDRSTHAVLDADKLPPELLVRSRKAGDRYGGPGHRKMKGMLINARIPLSMRDLQPMVVAGDAVIWVPGFLPAGPFRARPGSARCVILEARVHASDQPDSQRPGGSIGPGGEVCRRQE
jgi:tRNA(Ile)-lysidine synthase